MSVLLNENKKETDLSAIIAMIHVLFNCEEWNKLFLNLSLNDIDIFEDIQQLYKQYISNKNNFIDISLLLQKIEQNGCSTSSPIDFLMFLLNFINVIKEQDFKGWFHTKYQNIKKCFMCDTVQYDSNDMNINNSNIMIEIPMEKIFSFISYMEYNPTMYKNNLMKIYKEYVTQNALECEKCKGNFCTEMKNAIDNNISKYLIFNLNCSEIDLNDKNNKNMFSEMLNEVISGCDLFDNEKFKTEVNKYFYRISSIIVMTNNDLNLEKYSCFVSDFANKNYIYYHNQAKSYLLSFNIVKQLIANNANLCGVILIYQNILFEEKVDINRNKDNNTCYNNINSSNVKDNKVDIINTNKMNKEDIIQNNNKDVNKSNANIKEISNKNENTISKICGLPTERLCVLCFNPLDFKQQICLECRAFNG